MVECESLTKPIAVYLRWAQFIVAFMMFIGGLIHLYNELDGGEDSWCSGVLAEDYNCIGKSLVWAIDDSDKIGDANTQWRTVFTLAPDYFCDAWTPFFYGIFAMMQSFPEMKMDFCVGTWGRCLGFWLLGTFWALFGYAGNFGVMWGFLSSLGMCPFFLVMAMFDATEHPETQCDLRKLLERFGLASAEPGTMEQGKGPAMYNDDNAAQYGHYS